MNRLFSFKLVKYGIVGIAGMFLDFFITWFCKEKLLLNKFISNSLGFSFAVVNNYLLNRFWTFQSSGVQISHQFIKFVAIALVGLMINNMLLYISLKKLKWNFYLIKLFVTAIVFFWNFSANSLITFS